MNQDDSDMLSDIYDRVTDISIATGSMERALSNVESQCGETVAAEFGGYSTNLADRVVSIDHRLDKLDEKLDAIIEELTYNKEH